jgi:putative heme iron utilization protein
MARPDVKGGAAMAEEGETAPALEARRLLRAARGGTLATATSGQPFASLVTPATAPDLSVLLLLSSLSEHTRHLREEPRCALMVSGAPDGPNPQTAPRVTVTGLASLEEDRTLRARWVTLHPYAAFYADFGDFSLWRIRPVAALFVGGFARAHRLRQADLLPDPAAVAAVAAAEASILQHCNDEHAAALTRIAHRAGASGGGWQMVACDVDGCDLLQDERVLRVAWSRTVAGVDEVREELVGLG